MAQRSDNVIVAYLRLIDGQVRPPRGRGDRRGQATEPRASRTDTPIWETRPDTVAAAVRTLGAAAAIAAAYFLAARLGLALLSKPSDVAVFWPASGIAAGILIISGRRARLPLVVGVVVGTVAANLMSDRSLLTSLLKGFCNAGEAVLTAWLIEQWFGREFTFDNLRRVLGFVAAAFLGDAASALGGATTMTLFHTAAPFWDVWRAWFLSDGVGIVVVAPLIIGLSQLWREPPSQGEWVEGVVGVTLLGLISWYVVWQPSGSWLSFDPDELALPPLLWLTARCQPGIRDRWRIGNILGLHLRNNVRHRSLWQ